MAVTQNLRAGKSRKRPLAVMIPGLLLGLAAPLLHAADDLPVPEVTITGSAIRGNPDAASARPVTIITAEQIAKTNTVRLEQLLLKLPSVGSQGTTGNQNNGGYGTSNIDLRNLGSQRTLVLVDGKRFVGTDYEASAVAVDMNAIPVDMIERIEVLRDAASPIYGSDAIAGVINVITKRNFSGVVTTGGVGVSGEGDKTTYDISSTFGHSWERGNVTVNVGYNNSDPILQRDRKFSRNQFKPDLGPTSASSKPAGLRVLDSELYFTSPTKARSWDSDNDFFDLSQEPFLTSALERKSFNGSGHFDLTPNVVAVADVFYTNRNSEQRLNPEPLSNDITTQKYPGLFFPATYQVRGANGVLGAPIANPNYTAVQNFMTAKGLGALPVDGFSARTRRFDLGNRQYTQEVDTFRVHAGFEGLLLDRYDWSLGYVYGKSDSNNNTQNEVNFTHLGQLTGQFPCSQADVRNGCGVANFVGLNTLTPAQANYLTFDNNRVMQVEQDFFYARLGGSLLELPAGPLGFALGVERRNESGFDNPDTVVLNGDGSSDAQSTRGEYDVTEGYAEFKVPLLKGLPLVKSLTMDGAVRVSDYSNFGTAVTWKSGLDYAVNDTFRVRGSHGIGFRAPQVKELYGGRFQTFPNTSDPCDTSAAYANAVVAANCKAQLTALGINPATFLSSTTQTATITGGNANLEPEKSKSWSGGLVITPSMVPNLQVTLDYYRTSIVNAIGIFNTQDILDTCYGSVGLSSPQCAAITRKGGISGGNLTNVDAFYTNAGLVKTDGFDFGFDYRYALRDAGVPVPGDIVINHMSTLMLNYTNSNPDGSLQELVGRFDELSLTGLTYPDFRMSTRFGYEQEKWGFGVDVRYISDMLSKYTDSDPSLLGTSGAQVPDVVYFDLSGNYTWKNTTFYAGIDNLTDRAPPFVYNGDTNALSGGAYDFVGRFFWTRVSVKF